ncbi:MAG: phage holin family protein [Chlorobiaceae bacterium]|nr:phage holin family protein [Chlorobiaceae bacterium]NTV26345.1 phage holin family protein [Chlorobiaceae bacterium]
MVRILLHWLVNAIAVYATAHLLPGITIRNFAAALIVALVLGLINALLKPVLVFFSIPFIILTLGLFMLVINALMLQLAAVFVDGFSVQSFWWAVLGSLCISFVAWLLAAILNI